METTTETAKDKLFIQMVERANWPLARILERQGKAERCAECKRLFAQAAAAGNDDLAQQMLAFAIATSEWKLEETYQTAQSATATYVKLPKLPLPKVRAMLLDFIGALWRKVATDYEQAIEHLDDAYAWLCRTYEKGTKEDQRLIVEMLRKETGRSFPFIRLARVIGKGGPAEILNVLTGVMAKNSNHAVLGLGAEVAAIIEGCMPDAQLNLLAAAKEIKAIDDRVQEAALAVSDLLSCRDGDDISLSYKCHGDTVALELNGCIKRPGCGETEGKALKTMLESAKRWAGGIAPKVKLKVWIVMKGRDTDKDWIIRFETEL